MSEEELRAPLPAPAFAEDRREPALHTGTLHPAVRATSGGFGTKALSGVSCGDWLTVTAVSARPALFPLSPAHPRLVSPLPSHVTYIRGTRRLPRSSTTSGLWPAGFTG